MIRLRIRTGRLGTTSIINHLICPPFLSIPRLRMGMVSSGIRSQIGELHVKAFRAHESTKTETALVKTKDGNNEVSGKGGSESDILSSFTSSSSDEAGQIIALKELERLIARNDFGIEFQHIVPQIQSVSEWPDATHNNTNDTNLRLQYIGIVLNYLRNSKHLPGSGPGDFGLEPILDHALVRLSRSDFVQLLQDTISIILNQHTLNLPNCIDNPVDVCIRLFTSTLLKQDGYLHYVVPGKHFRERSILKQIYATNPKSCVSTLLQYLLQSTNQYFSGSLASTYLQLLATTTQLDRELSAKHAMDIWTTKVQTGLASSLDLHSMMTLYFNHDQSQKALDIYNDNEPLHKDWLFDIVLKCHAALKNWAGMQQCFESLFDRGDLPNLAHYRIVIGALSPLGRVDIVDTLFDGLVSREFKPTIAVFNALIYTRFALGSLSLSLELFNRIPEFGLSPNRQTYRIMLMVSRDYKDLPEAMKLIKQMLDRELPVTMWEVATLLGLCAYCRNHVAADQIVEWAKDGLGLEMSQKAYIRWLKCHLEANHLERAKAIYQEMIGNGFKPTTQSVVPFLSVAARFGNSGLARWVEQVMVEHKLPLTHHYTATRLFYLGEGRSLKAAVDYFEQCLEKARETGTEAQLSDHIQIMMNIYSKRQPQKAIDLYESIEEVGVMPNLRLHQGYIDLKRRRMMSATSTAEMQEFVEDFLQRTGKMVDLHSRTTPRDIIPVDIITSLCTMFKKQRNYPAIKLLVARYQEVSNRKDPVQDMYKIYSILLTSSAYCGYLHDTAEYWDLFLRDLRRSCYVLHNKSGDGQLIPMLPKRYRAAYWREIDAKLKSLSFLQLHKEMVPFLNSLAAEGFEVVYKNRLTLARELLTSNTTVLDGLKVVEELCHEQPPGKPRTRLPIKPRSIYIALPSAIEVLVAEKGCTSTEAMDLLIEKYPSIMEHVNKRRLEGGYDPTSSYSHSDF